MPTRHSLLLWILVRNHYYANTQEDKFYTIGGARKFEIDINGEVYNISNINKTIRDKGVIQFSPAPTEEEKANFIFIGSQNSRYRRWKANDIRACIVTGKSTNNRRIRNNN